MDSPSKGGFLMICHAPKKEEYFLIGRELFLFEFTHAHTYIVHPSQVLIIDMDTDMLWGST